jgi:hypothetical protein
MSVKFFDFANNLKKREQRSNEGSNPDSSPMILPISPLFMKKSYKKRKKVQHEFLFSSPFFVASHKDSTLSRNRSELQLLTLELMLITYPLDNKQ